MSALKRNWLPLSVFVLLLLGYVLAPFDPNAQKYAEYVGQGAVWPHIFGVDTLGRDVLSQVWRGAANSLTYAFVASIGVLAISSLLLTAERKGGRIVARLINAIVSLGIAWPVMFLGLLFLIFLEPRPIVLVYAIAIAGSPFAFRQLRVLWIEQSGATYVEASRAIGGSSWRVFRFSILPNLLPQLVEIWKIVFAIAILELSGLTYLGLAGDTKWVELGTLLKQNQEHLNSNPMLVLWPGFVLCFALWVTRLIRTERT